jgi:hypothetical protein
MVELRGLVHVGPLSKPKKEEHLFESHAFGFAARGEAGFVLNALVRG